MNENKAILISLLMNIDTYSLSRNVEEKQLSIDITDNEDFNTVNIKLAANPDGANTKSVKVIQDVESFFYLYSPYPVKVTFKKLDNTEFTLDVEDLVILKSAFSQITVKNLNIEQAASIRMIYS